MAQKLNHNSKINSTAPGGSQKNDGIKKYRQEKGITYGLVNIIKQRGSGHIVE